MNLGGNVSLLNSAAKIKPHYAIFLRSKKIIFAKVNFFFDEVYNILNISNMPLTKNALIRYKTIDNCLRNRCKRWTLDMLVDACSEALYDYEGVGNISKRTVQLDLQMMRSDRYGYNAPIEVYEQKYYRYADPDYSITNLPLSQRDYEMMQEAVGMLRQFQDFDFFTEMSDVVNRMQDQLAVSKSNRKPIVDFERNSNLIGLKYLNPLYNYISRKQVINVHYQSFTSLETKTWTVSPYLLKEYRNRWFLLGMRHRDGKLLTMALDRIKGIDSDDNEQFVEKKGFDSRTFFKDVIGVTKTRKTPLATVRFEADKDQAPYVETKPLHASQMVLERDEDTGKVIFEIKVVLNVEFYAQILSFGPGVKILAPEAAVKTMRDMVRKMYVLYP